LLDKGRYGEVPNPALEPTPKKLGEAQGYRYGFEKKFYIIIEILRSFP